MITQLDASAKESKQPEPAYLRLDVCKTENYAVFEKAGLCSEDARCCVFALAFYTGSGSKESSRGASLKVRQSNVLMNSEVKDDIDEYLAKYNHIVYFLSLALRHLPYYWGPVVRYITLDDRMATAYKPGSVVTWTQFSSSKRGRNAAARQAHCTVLVLRCRRGRSFVHTFHKALGPEASPPQEDIHMGDPFARGGAWAHAPGLPTAVGG
eukprot:1474926-Amphidinium_carterae.1